ncbi:hypothetical protein ABPG74_011960 [Tetrahymena malaccensis]
MDEEDSQNNFKTQSFCFGQKKAIILSESISQDKNNNKKKQCLKNCSFKKIRKNTNYEGIKIIQTIGKRYLLTNNDIRCKFKYISLKKFQLKTKSINDYVSSFFETTFEKTFMRNFKALDFSKPDQGESNEFTLKFKSNSSAISRLQFDQDRIMQSTKFQQQEFQRGPSLLGQYQEPNIHQIIQQKIVDLNNQSSISSEIDQKSLLDYKKTKFENQNNHFINSHEGDFGQKNNLDQTQYQLIIQTMFNYLEQIKQNFEYKFSLTDNHIYQDQAKGNSIISSNLSVINKQMLNPYMQRDKDFESLLPPIQLKQDQKNKFKDYIIKIFNSFILRGRERRQSGSVSQQNTQVKEDLATQDSRSVHKKTLSKEGVRYSIDCSVSDYDNDEDDDDDDDYDNDEQDSNQKDSNEINQQGDQNNLLSFNKRKSFQINLERPEYQNQTQLNELDCNKQIAADRINNNQLSTVMSKAGQFKKTTINQSKFQSQNVESSQVKTEILIKQGSITNLKFKQSNDEQRSEKQQKMIENSRKNSISSPQQNINSQQSKYHNLKNSFMHLIIQIFTKEVLSCFELPISYLDYSTQILERMKNYSFKYRPVKGRYQYYSNIHYSTLFLKLNKNTLGEIQQCAHYIQYHKVFFNEDISSCQKESDFAVIKCNFYKILIGQIVLFALQNAEEILLNEINLKNNQNYLDSSRFNYINKVKKGIQKLQRAKHAIRF